MVEYIDTTLINKSKYNKIRMVEDSVRIYRQSRKHKKKRINKKWLKRYDYMEVFAIGLIDESNEIYGVLASDINCAATQKFTMDDVVEMFGE